MEEQNPPIAENRMGYQPIFPLLMRISLPMVFSMLIQAMYNVVDSLFVARLGEDALSAVSLAFPVQNLMIAVSVGTGIGVNALLSKRLGEQNWKQVTRTAENGIILAGFSYLLFLLFGLFGAGWFFRIQTDSAALQAYGFDYLSVVTVFSFGLFGQVCFERLLQSTGKTVLVMISQGLGALINIILDPILIFGLGPFPRLEVRGAAIATVAGQIIGCIFAVAVNRLFNHELRLRLRKIRVHFQTIREIYGVGLPSIIMQSIASVMTLGMNNILLAFNTASAALGDTAVAAFGVYFKLQSFVFMPVFGFNNGLVPIIAYNYGAGRPKRMAEAIRWSVLFDCGYMLLGTLVLLLFPAEILSWFNASENLLAIGVPALRIIGSSYVIAAFCIVCSSVFQALGNGLYSMIVSIARQLVVLLPVAFLLARTGRLALVWWAFPIAEVACLLVTLIFFRRIWRQKISLISEESA